MSLQPDDPQRGDLMPELPVACGMNVLWHWHPQMPSPRLEEHLGVLPLQPMIKVEGPHPSLFTVARPFDGLTANFTVGIRTPLAPDHVELDVNL